jgi:hypothetical protein
VTARRTGHRDNVELIRALQQQFAEAGPGGARVN